MDFLVLVLLFGALGIGCWWQEQVRPWWTRRRSRARTLARLQQYTREAR